MISTASIRNPTLKGEKKKKKVPAVAQWVKDLMNIHEVVRSILGLAQWVKDLMLP